jgi:hypothetical protein
MSLCRFHSNVELTVGWQWVCGISIVTQQCGQRRWYGNGVCYIRKSCRSCSSSCVLEGKQIGRVLAGCDFRSVICELYSRTDRSCTRVRILEELWTVIKSCVLNCECNKVPSWNRTCEFVTVLSIAINRKFITWVERIVGEYQSGFRQGRSTIDHIFCIRQMLQKGQMNKMGTCTTYS